MEIKTSKKYLRAFDEQNSLYEAYARQNGLVGKSLYILIWLYYTKGGITQKRIVEKTHSSKQVVFATIKGWRAKGYISTCENPKDRRNKLLTLSPDGQAFAAKILDPLERIEVQALASLSESEREILIDLTKRYTQELKKMMQVGENKVDDWITSCW